MNLPFMPIFTWHICRLGDEFPNRFPQKVSSLIFTFGPSKLTADVNLAVMIDWRVITGYWLEADKNMMLEVINQSQQRQ